LSGTSGCSVSMLGITATKSRRLGNTAGSEEVKNHYRSRKEMSIRTLAIEQTKYSIFRSVERSCILGRGTTIRRQGDIEPEKSSPVFNRY
jgi:hypothetical protein